MNKCKLKRSYDLNKTDMIIHQSVRHLACILDDTIMSEIKTENSTDEFFNSKNELLASQL